MILKKFPNFVLRALALKCSDASKICSFHNSWWKFFVECKNRLERIYVECNLNVMAPKSSVIFRSWKISSIYYLFPTNIFCTVWCAKKFLTFTFWSGVLKAWGRPNDKLFEHIYFWSTARPRAVQKTLLFPSPFSAQKKTVWIGRRSLTMG